MVLSPAPESIARGAGLAMRADAHVRCPSCGGGDVAILFVKNGHRVQQCRHCELGFLPSQPSTEALETLYSTSYFTDGGFEGYPNYVGDESVHRQQARHYLRDLARAGVTRGTVLDVGCAAGFFLDEARRDGWRVAGCDVSHYAAGHARERLGLDVLQGNFAEMDLPVSTVDLATLWSVIAHVPNPRAVEQRLAQLVRPGGHVALETSNYRAFIPRVLGSRWHLCSPPSVMYYYSRRSLDTLFDPSRWRLVTFRPAIKWLTLEHALSRLEHRASSRTVARALASVRRLVPDALSVPYALGDLVFVVFQRRIA
jgi:SAM-dependent methyltransferase